MKTCKKLLASFLLLIFSVIFIALPISAVTIPQYSSAPNELYVTDEANILSGQATNKIIDKCVKLYEDYGVTLTVVTIDFLPDGYDSEEYAYEIYNSWGVDNDGLLFLVVAGEYKQWIATGNSLTNKISGGELTEIIYEYFPDYNFDEDFDTAILGVVTDVIALAENSYGYIGNNDNATNNIVSPETSYDTLVTDEEPASFFDFIIGTVFICVFFGVIILIVVLIITSIRRSARAPRRAAPPPPPVNGGKYYAPRRPYRPFYTPPVHHHRPMSPPPPGGFGGIPPIGRPNSFNNSRPNSGSSSAGRTGFGGSSSRPGSSSHSSFGGSSSRSSFGGGGSRGGGGGRK
ncbi:MAG: TPM domain-containing protein [Oscillospiraceae bacterium]|nr:TPM domain-containing protein [Oscillospiraceae bacterium]